MKTIVIIAVSLLTLNCVYAQKIDEKNIPASVKDGFSKKFSGIKVKKWEKEEGNYEAEFYLNKVESSAVFDSTGNFKELEQEIKISELPKLVSEYCSKNYSSYKLKEAAKITDSNDKVMFEAEMIKDKEHFDAIFDQQGIFIKKGDIKLSGNKD